MPSPTAAIDIIKTAMRHIGVLATGETPDAAAAADGLAALNDVLESWTLDGLAVWTNLTDNFTTVGANQSYTVGPTGVWVTALRPVMITGVYTLFNGVEYPARPWTFDQYNSVPIKNTGATFPERYAYINDFPNGTLFLWPVPAPGATIRLDIQTQLASVPTIATALTYPPGYVRALQWALAAELAPQYGIKLDTLQQQLVTASKADIMRSNRTPAVSRFDWVLTGGPIQTWQGG